MADINGEHTLDLGSVDGPYDSDLANARRLVARFGDQIRHVVAWGKWLVWDDTRWKPDDTGRAVLYAKGIADDLPDRNHRGDKASRTQSAAGIAAMLTLAATEPGIAVTPGDLDADPYLLNVGNGTLDLHTGHLRPHNPADLITKICGANYDPNAEAPQFHQFLHQIQPDPDMRDFLARLFGHSMLGVVVEHVLPVLYGSGANGKTTLVETVRKVFGDYGAPVDSGLLIERFGEAHPTGIASLFGLRLAVTSETDEGRRLATATVKKLTGADQLAARRMREDFWTFTPSHSLVMLTNHKPLVRGDDDAIWRRLRLIPFDLVIPDDEQDHHLLAKLEAELDGVLGWLFDGLMEWKSRGLAEPKPVTAATDTYRDESDLLGLFLAEKTMSNPHAAVRSSDLFDAYVAWCKRENVDAGTQTAFSRTLLDRGYEKQKTRTGSYWQGIDLYPDEPGH